MKVSLLARESYSCLRNRFRAAPIGVLIGTAGHNRRNVTIVCLRLALSVSLNRSKQVKCHRAAPLSE